LRHKGIGALAISINILSVILLARAMKVMPVGTAYAVWTGIGAVGTAALGMYLFHEPRNALRILCMAVIILGMIGLEAFGEHTG
jgi:quaternary ammonium compound-resistance protein SugE